ncbi:hypothetical protein AB9X29_003717 [Vibrio vulnificus]
MLFNFGKKEKKTAVAKVTKKTQLEVSLSRLSKNLSMSGAHIDALYRPILLFTERSLAKIGQEDKIIPIVDALDKMLRFRRGVTIPAGIEPEQVQRYREISSFTLVTVVLSKVLADYSSRYALQYDVHGEIRNYPLIFGDALPPDSQLVGVTENRSCVIGNGVDVGLTVMMMYKLYSKTSSEVAMAWYASFPDMIKISLMLCEGSYRGVMSDIVEKYYHMALSGCITPNLSVNEETAPAINNGNEEGTAQQASVKVGKLFESVAKVHTPVATSATSTTEATPATSPPPITSQSEALAKLLGTLPKSDKSSDSLTVDKEDREATQPPKDSAIVDSYLNFLNGHTPQIANSETNEGEAVVVVPVDVHREICIQLFGHLKGEQKRNAERSLMTDLKPFLRCPTTGDRAVPMCTENGERVYVYDISFYQQSNNKELTRFVNLKMTE